MDFEKLVLTFTVKADIIQKAKYNITGKVMLLPVYGEGESTLKFGKFSIFIILYNNSSTGYHGWFEPFKILSLTSLFPCGEYSSS